MQGLQQFITCHHILTHSFTLHTSACKTLGVIRSIASYQSHYPTSRRWISRKAKVAVDGRVGAGVEAIIAGAGQIWDDRSGGTQHFGDPTAVID